MLGQAGIEQMLRHINVWQSSTFSNEPPRRLPTKNSCSDLAKCAGSSGLIAAGLPGAARRGGHMLPCTPGELHDPIACVPSDSLRRVFGGSSPSHRTLPVALVLNSASTPEVFLPTLLMTDIVPRGKTTRCRCLSLAARGSNLKLSLTTRSVAIVNRHNLYSCCQSRTVSSACVPSMGWLSGVGPLSLTLNSRYDQQPGSTDAEVMNQRAQPPSQYGFGTALTAISKYSCSDVSPDRNVDAEARLRER
jgi:hypothetical protein